MALKAIVQAVILLLLALAAGAASKAFHPAAPAWYLQAPFDEFAITPEAVEERFGGEVVWVDARTRESFEAGHMPGAILLNREEWNDLLLESFETLAASDRPIVVYCDGATCGKSREVAEELRDLGMVDVYYLKGGWQR